MYTSPIDVVATSTTFMIDGDLEELEEEEAEEEAEEAEEEEGTRGGENRQDTEGGGGAVPVGV